MQLGKVGFLVFLLFWVWAVVADQEKKKEPPFPLNLFAQAKASDFIGEKECADCHRAYVESFERSPHAAYVRHPNLPADKRGCEACHGPGEFHLEEVKDLTKVVHFEKAKPKEIASACLRCHAETMRLAHWNRTPHAQAEVACTSCHQIHRGVEPATLPAIETTRMPKAPVFVASLSPKRLLKGDEVALCSSCHRKEAAEFRRNFHHPVPEGRMTCTECHDIHPNRTATKRIQPLKGMCVTCHAEVAGPFVFTHDPVVGGTGEECLECHRPHGSNNPRLLKAFSRGLCNQCHTDKANNHFPGHTCWNSGCHPAIHGSNSDMFLRRP